MTCIYFLCIVIIIHIFEVEYQIFLVCTVSLKELAKHGNLYRRIGISLNINIGINLKGTSQILLLVADISVQIG